MLRTIITGASLAMGLSAGSAMADPWKDESGKGRERGAYGYEREGDWGGGYGVVPPGHLPPPGLCRVWIEGRPPGQQPSPVSCRRAERIAARYGDAFVVDSRGGYRDHPYRYGPRDYGYERVCEAFDRRGECLSVRLRPDW